MLLSRNKVFSGGEGDIAWNRFVHQLAELRFKGTVIFANVVVDLSDHLTTGIEVTSRKTLYQDTRAGQIPPALLTPSAPGEAVTIDWMVRYAF